MLGASWARGSHAACYCRAYAICACSNRQPPRAQALRSLCEEFPDQAIEAVTANPLTPRAAVEIVTDVPSVVHAAAGMRGGAADMFLNTVLAPRNLLDAVVGKRVNRVVLIGSFSVYRSSELPPHALLSEQTPLESTGPEKGPYSYAKARQERLFLDYAARYGVESAIIRPGVIYGSGGGQLSPRVGIAAMGWFCSLGGNARLLPTFVENCADAVAWVALQAPAGSVFNVVDDQLPRCAQYLRRYRRTVKQMRVMHIPYWTLLLGSKVLVIYNKRSKGQLPALFTPSAQCIARSATAMTP